MSQKPDSVLGFYQRTDKTRLPSTINAQRIATLKPFVEQGCNAMLDIGCYDGSKTRLLADLVGAQEIWGTDFLPDRLVQAQAHNIRTALVDLNSEQQLPFADARFDLIFVGDVIEHIFSPDFLLEEIARLLRPGGYALITTPNLASWRNRLVLLFGWQPFMTEVSTRYRVGNPRMPKGMPSGHIRMFTARALRELPRYYGLQVEHVGGLRLPGPAEGLVSRLSQLVDRAVVRFAPTLCDELIAKVRKR
jgi:SAM-dependent methyltransferase